MEWDENKTPIMKAVIKEYPKINPMMIPENAGKVKLSIAKRMDFLRFFLRTSNSMSSPEKKSKRSFPMTENIINTSPFDLNRWNPFGPNRRPAKINANTPGSLIFSNRRGSSRTSENENMSRVIMDEFSKKSRITSSMLAEIKN